ncbi:expressed unknown protein [Seminavis robusta]|uniref:Uncharacterized protein n=1 Tax=Seminavis robusta TaxID=568900 RepID=A0A9N8H4C9_9STRA|nr:expressed unknown protein [Seminavis robusta]|eukprot:Sro82_g043760.1 n/a (2291) ;mRNA; r:27747-34619
MVAESMRASRRPTRIPRYHHRHNTNNKHQHEESERTTANHDSSKVPSFFRANPPPRGLRAHQGSQGSSKQRRAKKEEKRQSLLEAKTFKYPPFMIETVTTNSNSNDSSQEQQKKRDKRLQEALLQSPKLWPPETKKESLQTKRRRFESLMADMLAKQRDNMTDPIKKQQTIENKNYNNNKHNRVPTEQVVFRDHKSSPKVAVQPRRVASDDQRFPPSRIIAKLKRTESHPPAHHNHNHDNETIKTDESPFRRLMDAPMDGQPTEGVLSPYSNLQFNLLGLLGSEIPVELQHSPIGKRPRGSLHDSAVERLQSLRQKAKFGLERLDYNSSRRTDARTVTFSDQGGTEKQDAEEKEEEEEEEEPSYSIDLTQTDSDDESAMLDLGQGQAVGRSAARGAQNNMAGQRWEQTVHQIATKITNNSSGMQEGNIRESAQNYILGSSSFLIEEAKKQKRKDQMGREPSERIRMTPTPFGRKIDITEQHREPSERMRISPTDLKMASHNRQLEPSERIRSPSYLESEDEERVKQPQQSANEKSRSATLKRQQRTLTQRAIREQTSSSSISTTDHESAKHHNAKEEPSQRMLSAVFNREQRQLSAGKPKEPREPSVASPATVHSQRNFLSQASQTASIRKPPLRSSEPPGSSPTPQDASLAPTFASPISDLASVRISVNHVNLIKNISVPATQASSTQGTSIAEKNSILADDDANSIMVIHTSSWTDSKDDQVPDVILSVGDDGEVEVRKDTVRRSGVSREGKKPQEKGHGSYSGRNSKNSTESKTSARPILSRKDPDGSAGGRSSRRGGIPSNPFNRTGRQEVSGTYDSRNSNSSHTPRSRQEVSGIYDSRNGNSSRTPRSRQEVGTNDSRNSNSSHKPSSENPRGQDPSIGTSVSDLARIRARIAKTRTEGIEGASRAPDPSVHDPSVHEARAIRDPQGRDPRGPDPPQANSPLPTRLASPPPTRLASPPPTRLASPPPTRLASPQPNPPPPTRLLAFPAKVSSRHQHFRPKQARTIMTTKDAPEQQYSFEIREIKESEDSPTVICLVESEIRDEVSGNESSSGRSRDQGGKKFIETIRKSVDTRLSRIKAKIEERNPSPNRSKKKVSTFVEDMKQGKNLRESLHQLRKSAKQRRREKIRSREKDVHEDEEIIFIDATEASPQASLEEQKISMQQENFPRREEGRRRDESPKKEPDGQTGERLVASHKQHKQLLRPAALSPITLDGILADEQSAESSYTSARSDLMTAPSVFANVVGTEIQCCDDGSELTASYEGWSSKKPSTPRTKGDADRKKGPPVTEAMPSPCTRRRNSLSAHEEGYTSNGPQKSGTGENLREDAEKGLVPPKAKTNKSGTEVADAAGRESTQTNEKDQYIGLPKQISTLLQSVGNHLVPSVPNGFLGMSKASFSPSKPTRPSLKDHDFADDVMAITESMAQQLGSTFITSERVAERQLQSMEIEAKVDEEAKMETGEEARQPSSEEQKAEVKKDTDQEDDRGGKEDVNFRDLKQQFSDLSEAVGTKFSQALVPDKGLWQSYCMPQTACLPKSEPKESKMPKMDIVSSSPIIAGFLKRRDRSLQKPDLQQKPDGKPKEKHGSVPPLSPSSHHFSESSINRSQIMSELTTTSDGQRRFHGKMFSPGNAAESTSDEPQVLSHKSTAAASDVSSEMQRKKALFGRLVSPLTLPTEIQQAPGKATPVNLNKGSPSNGMEVAKKERKKSKAKEPKHQQGKPTPQFPPLLVRRSMLDETSSNCATSETEGRPSYEDSDSSAFSKSGVSSISTRHPIPLSDGISSLGDSTQTETGTSFMTSFFMKDTIMHKMSSVSESDTGDSFEPTPTYPSQSYEPSSSSPPPSEEHRKLDPPCGGRVNPPGSKLERNGHLNPHAARLVATPSPLTQHMSQSEAGPYDSEQHYSDMSYSVDSPGDCSSSSYYFNEKVQGPRPSAPVPTAREQREPTENESTHGNPLKKLLSRPRVPRRIPREISTSSSAEDDSRYRRPRTPEPVVSARQHNGYPGYPSYPTSDHLFPAEPIPRRPDASERQIGRHQDEFLDEELTRLQSCFDAACGADPPGMLDDNRTSLEPALRSVSRFNNGGISRANFSSNGGTSMGNIDNLVLESLGIPNKMDQLRMSLTFSPGNSFAPTLTPHRSPSPSLAANRAAATLLQKYQALEDEARKKGRKSRPVEDDNNTMISSVSERSASTVTYSTLDDAGASNFEEDKELGRSLNNANTMETDRAYARGSRNRPTTPQTLRAFRSKSWKLDDDDTGNSIMASDSGVAPSAKDSKSGKESSSPSSFTYG